MGRFMFQADNGDIGSVKFEGGDGNKDILIPKEGGVLATEQSVQTALDLISPTPLSISATLKGSFSLVGGQLQVAKGVFSHSYGVSDSGKVDNKITTFDGTFIPDNGWQE